MHCYQRGGVQLHCRTCLYWILFIALQHTTFSSVLPVQLVLEVLSKCEGAYGLLIKSAYYPGELVACKRGSPLLLGVKTAARTPHTSPKRPMGRDGAFEAFIASDASAFVEHTNQCVPFTLLFIMTPMQGVMFVSFSMTSE